MGHSSEDKLRFSLELKGLGWIISKYFKHITPTFEETTGGWTKISGTHLNYNLMMGGFFPMFALEN